MADFPVTWYDSSMVGATVMSGTAGSRLALLRACLVDGFGATVVSDLRVVDGVATATVGVGETLPAHAVVAVNGADQESLNGRHRVRTQSETQMTWLMPGQSDVVATGTVIVRVAPAGWELVYHDDTSHVGVFRSADIVGTRAFLRVDDSDDRNVRVRGYMDMSDIDSGVDMFPDDAQVSGGGWWPAADAADAAPRSWTLAADSRAFVLRMQTSAASPGAHGSLWGFGDADSLRSGDPYSCMLQCAGSDLTAQTTTPAAALEYMSAVYGGTGGYMPRNVLGLSSSSRMDRGVDAALDSASAQTSGAAPMTARSSVPLAAGSAIMIARQALADSYGVRAFVPGLRVIPAEIGTALHGRRVIWGDAPGGARRLLVVPCGSPAAGGPAGAALIDISGPWRSAS